MSTADDALRAAKPDSAPPCPICGMPARDAVKPFCSPRCADVDLGRWLSDGYAIPAPEEDAPDPVPDRSR